MGILNLLKANYTGKVGQTVGAKWKDKSTIRVYTKPADPHSAAQELVRGGFGGVSEQVAAFADQIRSLNPLSTKSMTLRNAIIKLNKEMVAAGAFVGGDLLVSRGGLPVPQIGAAAVTAGLASATIPFTKIEGANISTKCKIVAILLDATNKEAFVGSALNAAESVTVTGAFRASTQYHVYLYALDFRGSSKVGSVNDYKSITSPAQ